VQLRPIEERDLDAVRRLRNANRQWFFYDREVTPEQHRAWFDGLGDGPMRFYVMEEDGEVVGTVSVKDTPDGTEFGNLIVDDRYRGHGLALQTLEELTSEPGIYFSNILPENAASIGALQRVGFSLEHVVLVKRV
jgi:RimJ/RimL family protein N-acetyltransferase